MKTTLAVKLLIACLPFLVFVSAVCRAEFYSATETSMKNTKNGCTSSKLHKLTGELVGVNLNRNVGKEFHRN